MIQNLVIFSNIPSLVYCVVKLSALDSVPNSRYFERVTEESAPVQATTIVRTSLSISWDHYSRSS